MFDEPTEDAGRVGVRDGEQADAERPGDLADDRCTEFERRVSEPVTGVDGDHGRSGSGHDRNGPADDLVARQVIGVGRQVCERHVADAVGLPVPDTSGGGAGLERRGAAGDEHAAGERLDIVERESDGHGP